MRGTNTGDGAVYSLLVLTVQDPTIGVPLTITLLVVFGYILMGAAMFGVWEDWEATEAAYFCFLAVSQRRYR